MSGSPLGGRRLGLLGVAWDCRMGHKKDGRLYQRCDGTCLHEQVALADEDVHIP